MTPKYIILHHSLTKDSETVSWGVIRRYHMNVMGWVDIGYQWGIEQARDDYEILVGRMPNESGAHTKGINSRSLGVCFVGNFDLIQVPDEQWLLGLKLVRWIMFEFNVPKENVCGHRKFAPYKSCPGKLFDVEMFRSQL